MIYRWWIDLKDKLNETVGNVEAYLQTNKEKTDRMENFSGLVSIGNDTFVSNDARMNGNIIIGNNCMIGTGVIIRGNVRIYDNVRIGYGVEIKDSIIKDSTTIGPLCYIGNSLIEKNVYLGALVRTSNHRLDKARIKSWNGETFEDTGLEKLGAWIKENTNLGVGAVILPGRIVPENSTFSPHIVITKNYSTGIYKMVQNILKAE